MDGLMERCSEGTCVLTFKKASTQLHIRQKKKSIMLKDMNKFNSLKNCSMTKKAGPIRDSNSGPPRPERGIMPLDQWDSTLQVKFKIYK